MEYVSEYKMYEFFPSDMSLSQSQVLGYTKESLIWLGIEMEKMKVKLETLEEIIGKKEVSEEFRKKLISLKGIGEKIAQDIVLIFPTEEDLIKYLKSGKELPFSANINKLLMENFTWQ
jgi:ERCC4-type nuclease